MLSLLPLCPSSPQIISVLLNIILSSIFELQYHCNNAQSFSPFATQPLTWNILLPKHPLWQLKFSMEDKSFHCTLAVYNDFFWSLTGDTFSFSFSLSSCIVYVWIWTWGKLSIAGWSAEIPKSPGLWFGPALFLSSWGGYPICLQTKQVSV